MDQTATQLIWRAAKALNRDPLKSLGIPGSDTLTPELAVFVLAMEDPEYHQAIKDHKTLQTIREKFAHEKAVKASLPGGTGFTGPRGTYMPKERRSSE
ncbi:hypothetical protein [Deinococcus cellulosilyticus]|uniref:Uncharacterized protein n=1 Tax=Deinococcus cellulosilyticus (strain DSM 18568 / NBRC 106333 / KACC 11606 / 5516J-15) TaxID=1223518 RepID=A0A511N760_DEIC1|nr:hypothetical protein [Deinococcus cellulosilyticus]GEM48689.1 hypothetical protein DC3_43240 [Deinococcus cellulosilyticus NBRC 106333 = KACC 11606]